MSCGTIPAGPAHAALLAAVHGAACPVEPWDEAAFAAQLAIPGTFGFAHPRGGMVLARVMAEMAEILTLAVVPRSRRNGLGRQLMRAALAEAADRGAAAMLLEVSDTNQAAQALYVALGFTEVGKRPRYYRDGSDAVVLRLGFSPGAAAGS